MAGVTGLRYSFPRHESSNVNSSLGGSYEPSSPLFERLGPGADELAELQQSRQIIENLQERLSNLERINNDLEYRLEDQARQCIESERECLMVKREWTAKCDKLLKEIEAWKNKYNLQESKAHRLREQITRTERELYGILQRKYEFMRGQDPGGSTRKSLSGGGSFHLSESAYLMEEGFFAPQTMPPQSIRKKRIVESLADFFMC